MSADLEHGFADDPAGVAETVRLALDTGLAGCSIEDSTKRPDDPIYETDLAAERVQAAVDAAGSGDLRSLVTARYEGFLFGEQGHRRWRWPACRRTRRPERSASSRPGCASSRISAPWWPRSTGR